MKSEKIGAAGGWREQAPARSSASLIVGIPRALEYYKNKVLWTTFFEELGIKTVVSPPTNREILNRGLRLAVDESCLPSKIFLGHVEWLWSKCHRILIPRIESFGKNDMLCVKLWALRDIVKNTFPALSSCILDYNIDGANGLFEQGAYLGLGKELGFSRRRTAAAYKKAKAEQQKAHFLASLAESKKLNSKKLKILVSGHSYNVHDALIGAPVLRYLEKSGAEAIAAADLVIADTELRAAELSPTLYWTRSKDLAAAVRHCAGKVDGIILLTAFPCGPDSLVNELIMLKTAGVPVLNLVMDEHLSETGLVTRLESFLDMLTAKREACL